MLNLEILSHEEDNDDGMIDEAFVLYSMEEAWDDMKG